MIEISGLTKNFGGHKVLDEANLKIDTGSTCVIIGRSGCGKSVLLKHVVGILRPEQGKVLIGGKEVAKLKEKGVNKLHNRGVGDQYTTINVNIPKGLDKKQRQLLEELGI